MECWICKGKEGTFITGILPHSHVHPKCAEGSNELDNNCESCGKVYSLISFGSTKINCSQCVEDKYTESWENEIN